jgi:hypothetical protein
LLPSFVVLTAAQLEALLALEGSLTPSSKIKMMTRADRQRHIVNVTIQAE